MTKNIILHDLALPDDTDERLVSLYDYWIEKRGSRKFPSRQDIDPLDFFKSLPFIYLVEGSRMEDLVIRVAGTVYRELYGREITGHKVVDLIPPHQADIVLEDYEDCLRERAPVYREGQMFWRPREAKLTYQRLLLPLGPSDDEVTQMLAIAKLFSLDGTTVF